METKKLRRSLRESVVGGVAGGLGEYFNTDPVIFRILFVVLAFTGGGGLIIYLLMWIFIPKDTSNFYTQNFNSPYNETSGDVKDEYSTANDATGTPYSEKTPQHRSGNGRLIAGGILVTLGIFFLADEFIPWLSWEYLWPAALIIVGLAIIKVNYNSKK
jgi:phage shock protein PspC (stress-responsive transcriptional regulator)